MKFQLRFAFFIVPLLLCINARAQGTISPQSQFLFGLKGYLVRVETLGLDALAAGLRESDIKQAVEYQFQLNNIKTFTEEQAEKDPNIAVLNVSIPTAAIKTPTGETSLVYAIRLDVLQVMQTARDPSIKLISPSWSQSGLGYSPIAAYKSDAVKGVQGYVTKLCVDHIAGQIPAK